jgi:hypothetical protein
LVRLRASRFSRLTVKISRSGRSLPPVSTVIEDMEGIIAGAADAHKPSQCGPTSIRDIAVEYGSLPVPLAPRRFTVTGRAG